MSSIEQHRMAAPRSVRCAVVTVSDTRTVETDTSGALIRERLERAGHAVVFYAIVPDEREEIGRLVDELVQRPDCDAVLLNGGTGIARRDVTYEAIAERIEKRLDGFGELFRWLSYREIGTAAMLSRALAGVYRGRIVIAMPGSTGAVRLAMDELVLPELAHLVFEARK
ncbi:MAG: MogA/MoaB family molybdenum cofactor biosynthesis protein [Thermomicrobium sp.]|uniref:Molybdenum cofactor biosynthesis protein B n=2 Tax=Thermomicrobium roseum TaxID=500 RepID=B9L040_THERP|nr:MogA/MoaB family molybdenum cofactor biosynthesis protein [Thermomicrobium roseum]ACM06205.1 molybdenum cofactor biosynthesis protein B [Thermomicrobium roseum DSM 5159]MBO9403586.1 MogA/MoaB family molybdenum cofactor biosynthesis protein [Thermomicrobium sp.]